MSSKSSNKGIIHHFWVGVGFVAIGLILMAHDYYFHRKQGTLREMYANKY